MSTALLPRAELAAVLFDLDGTFADSADDLIAPVLAMRAAQGLEPMDPALLRPWASMGARGMIQHGLGVMQADARFADLRTEFLTRYEAALLVRTREFDGIAELVERLERNGLRWGIVSNKIERYLRPVVAGLDIGKRAGVVVGGDTTAFPKPHPAPLEHAARALGVAAAGCVYVGDDLRDIRAGQAAGMKTVAALYGYCGVDAPPDQWGADASIASPRDLPALLGLR